MKLKGLSDRSVERIAKSVTGQEDDFEDTEDTDESFAEINPAFPEYVQNLQRSYNRVSPEDYAQHKNLLSRLVPLNKDIDRFARDYEWLFSPEEFSVLQDARVLLENLSYPLSLLTVEEDDRPLVFF